LHKLLKEHDDSQNAVLLLCRYKLKRRSHLELNMFYVERS